EVGVPQVVVAGGADLLHVGVEDAAVGGVVDAGQHGAGVVGQLGPAGGVQDALGEEAGAGRGDDALAGQAVGEGAVGAGGGGGFGVGRAVGVGVDAVAQDGRVVKGSGLLVGEGQRGVFAGAAARAGDGAAGGGGHLVGDGVVQVVVRVV